MPCVIWRGHWLGAVWAEGLGEEESLLKFWVVLLTCQPVLPTPVRPGAPGRRRGKEAGGLGAGVGQPNKLGKFLRISPWGLHGLRWSLGGPLDVPKSYA